MAENPPATAKQRKWVPCGCLVAMFLIFVLVPVGAYMSWTYRSIGQVKTQLARVRLAGLPTEFGELDQFYRLVDGAEDATPLYLAAQSEFTGSVFDADAQKLPIIGMAEDGDAKIPPPGQPWADQAAVEAFLAKYEPALQVLHEAAAKGGAARFPLEFEDGFAMLLPHAQNMRTCSRVLALEAHVRAHRGDARGTAESLLAMAAMGRSLENQPILVSQLVRYAMDGVAVDLTARLLPYVDFSDEDLQRLRRAFRRDNCKAGIALALNGERVLGTEAFRDPAKTLGPDSRLPPGVIRGSNEDLAFFLELHADLHEAMNLPYPETFAAVEAAFDKMRDKLDTPFGRMRYPLTGMTFPAVEASVMAAARTDSSIRCLNAAIAVEQFRRREGKLPETLGELVPDLLSEVPIDPFDGQPIRYVVKPDCFLIYSCGRDQTDDGGVDDEQQTDIVIRIDRIDGKAASPQ